MSDKILITGSNGLLGQKLVSLLTEKGIPFLATSVGPNRIPDLSEDKYASMDITDAEATLQVISDYRPTVVIHTAAMANVDMCESEQEECHQLNVQGVINVAKAAEKADSFLVHLSTDFIFDGEDGPYTEDAEPNPISVYGQSKLDAELELQKMDANCAIARTVLVYGIVANMSRSNIILWVKKNIEEEKVINVVDDQLRSPTLAEDLAEGCLILAQKKQKGVFNVSGSDLLTPYDMAIKTADYFNLDKSFIHRTDGSKFSQPAKRPPKTGFIIDKMKALGYAPKSFEEGLRIVHSQMNM